MIVRILLLLTLLGAFGTTYAQNWSLTPTVPQGTNSDIQYWDEQLFVSTYEGHLFKSTDEGQSWQSLPLPGNLQPIFGLHRSRDRWFASCVGGYYESTNGGNSWRWVSIPSTYVPSGFAVLSTGHLVVSTADLVQGSPQASGIMRSTNNGQSWHSVSANLPGSSIFKLLHKDDDQLTLALNQPNQTAALFTTWLGPLGTFTWHPMPIRLFHRTDSSRADFKATEWFDMQWHNDTSILLSAAGVVQEAGAPNGVFTQWVGIRRNNPLTPLDNEHWVETISFGPQYNSWWDQPAPANILRHSEKPHIYGSLQGGNARGGAWILSDTTVGWQKRNVGIPPGPNGWEVLKFAEGPLGRVFAIHQGYAGVYFNDFSRRWATSTAETQLKQLRIWPNPGNGLLQVEWPAGSKNIQVLNSMGQVVWEASLNSQAPVTLDLQLLPAGMYFLRLEHQGTVYQAKYLKIN